MTKDRVPEEIVRLAERLRSLRDELRVKARLAKMDAVDTWDATTRQIDRTVLELERTAKSWETASDEARVHLHLGLMEARERANVIQEKVEGVWDQLAKVGEGIEQKVDLVELRAHLAKMEAEDFFHDKRAQFEKVALESKATATRLVEEGLTKVTDRLDAFFRRLS